MRYVFLFALLCVKAYAGAFYFDSTYSGDYLATSSDLDTAAVGFFIKVDDLSDNGIDTPIVDIDSGGATITIDDAGTIRAEDGWSTATVYLDGATPAQADVTTGVWHHVVVTMPSQQALAPLKFGGDGTTDFTGSLDDIRVWNDTVPANQVQSVYRSRGKRAANFDSGALQGWYRIPRNDYKRATDSITAKSWWDDGSASNPVNSPDTAIVKDEYVDLPADYLTIGNSTADQDRDGFCFEVWYQIRTNTDQFLFSKNNAQASQTGYGFLLAPTSSQMVGVMNASVLDIGNHGLIGTGWNHLVMDWDGSIIRYYVNGVQRGGDHYVSGYAADIDLHALEFGRNKSSGQATKLYEDDVSAFRMWDDNITSASNTDSVTALYNAGRRPRSADYLESLIDSGFTATLVHSYHFDARSDRIPNRIAGGATLTVVGTIEQVPGIARD